MKEKDKEIQANSSEQQPADESPTNKLTDLPVTPEQETQVSAGLGHVKAFDGWAGAEIRSR